MHLQKQALLNGITFCQFQCSSVPDLVQLEVSHIQVSPTYPNITASQGPTFHGIPS